MGKKKKLTKAEQAAFDKRSSSAKKGAATKRKKVKGKKATKSKAKPKAPTQFSTVVQSGQPRKMNMGKHGVKA